MRRTSPKLVGARTNEPDCLSDEANLAETQPRSAVPIPASTNRANQHCFASLALHTACACGAVGPFASLVTRRRRSLLRFSCVANRVCLWRRRSLRFARHRTASLIASLLVRCRRESSLHPMRTYTLPQLRRHVPLGRDERARSTPCAHTFAHTPHATKVSAEPEILSEANTKPTLVGTRTNER